MIRKDEINLGAQYFAPGQIWWFDLTPYDYKVDIDPHSRRPYLVIASVGRRIYVVPVTHGDANGSNFRFSIPTIRGDKPDGTPDISYVCMDNIHQIRIDKYVADGGVYTYAGCLTPAIMQKLMSGVIASLLFNNYGPEFIDGAFDRALDMLERREDYTITGFTPCVVHGDANLIITAEDEGVEYKKDYRMVDTIITHANRTYANSRKAVEEPETTEISQPVIAKAAPAEAISEEEFDDGAPTRKQKHTSYKAASIERGAIKFESDEMLENFARSLIEPDPNGRISIIDFQKEFTRVTGTFINSVPAERVVREVANSRTMVKNTMVYGCTFKKELLKKLIKNCPMDKFNKKKSLLDEIRADIQEYGRDITGYKWGYAPKYLTAFLTNNGTR